MTKAQEREFLMLASIWLACRLAAWGGTPLLPLHRPVLFFRSLGWALLGCTDYGEEMRLLLADVRNTWSAGAAR